MLTNHFSHCKLTDSILNTLAPNFFVPARDFLLKDKRFHYVTDVELICGGSISQIHDHQISRLQEICRNAYANCDFYKKTFDDAHFNPHDDFCFDDFSTIPTLSRETIRNSQAGLISRKVDASNLRASATGGTTASPVHFYMDWETYFRRKSATIYFDRWFGYEPGMKKALLWGARQDFPDSQSWRSKLIQKYVDRQKFLPTDLLDDDIFHTYYETLSRFAPEIIQSYPTPLALFAEYLLRNELSLKTRAVSTTAEALLDHQRQAISDAFGTDPFDWVGTRELGRVATECHVHDGLHINCYGVFAEVIDDPRMESPGMGRLVLTDLFNTAMPMIRYDIGDISSISHDPCQCGSELPRLSKLFGRTTDIFENSTGQRIPGVAFTNRFIVDCDQVLEMQIIQRKIREFTILIVKGPNFSVNTKIWLAENLNKFMGETTNLECRVVSEIPLEKSGKRLFCRNLISDD